jgi:hypothetical protein
MTIPNFSVDEDKDEISPMECLRTVKEYCMRIGISPCGASFSFLGGAHKWWRSLNEDTRLHFRWKEFEKFFLDKWIRDTIMKEMYRIQDELKEAKEEIKKKAEELSKIISLDESLIKEVKNLK